MTDQETTLLIQEIIHKAEEGDSQQFKLIESWDEYMHYLKLIKSTKLVIKTLKVSANSLFKEYCRDVTSGISEIAKLLAYSQLLDIVAFYENDLSILRQMADEYDEYLGNFSNFWNSFLGGRRDI